VVIDPAAYSILWVVGIVAVVSPLAVRSYRRSLSQ
jgi:hypothetical protein